MVKSFCLLCHWQIRERVSFSSTHRYWKSQNRLLKVCYVPSTSASLSRLLFLFLRWPLTVLLKQIRQAVHAFKQSILLRCLWWYSLQPDYWILPSRLHSVRNMWLGWKGDSPSLFIQSIGDEKTFRALKSEAKPFYRIRSNFTNSF